MRVPSDVPIAVCPHHVHFVECIIAARFLQMFGSLDVRHAFVEGGLSALVDKSISNWQVAWDPSDPDVKDEQRMKLYLQIFILMTK